MTPLHLLAASMLSGTLDDGRTYVLYQDAEAATDIRLHGGDLRFLTAGGSIGTVDRQAMQVIDLRTPETPFLGFVQDAPGWWVFDAEGQVVALDSNGELESVIRAFPGRIGEAWWDGEQLHVVTRARTSEPGSLSWQLRFDGLGVRWWSERRVRKLPDSDAWHLHNGRMWWAANNGEFGAELGVVPGRVARRGLRVTDFAEVNEELIAFGGISHSFTSTAQWATLPKGETYSTSHSSIPLDRKPVEPREEPSELLWVGAVDGEVVALDDDGWLFVGGLESVEATQPFGPLGYRAERQVRAAVDGATAWLVDGKHGVLRVRDGAVTQLLPRTLPSTVDVRVREGRVWLVRGDAVWGHVGDPWAGGAVWTRFDVPLPDAEHLYVSEVVISADGPVWQLDGLYGERRIWLAGPSEGARLMAPHPLGYGISFVDTVHGPIQAVHRLSDCRGLDVPCVLRSDAGSPRHPEAAELPSPEGQLDARLGEAVEKRCAWLATEDMDVEYKVSQSRRERGYNRASASCALDSAGAVWRAGKRGLERWSDGRFRLVGDLPHLGAIYALRPAKDGLVASGASGVLFVGPEP